MKNTNRYADKFSVTGLSNGTQYTFQVRGKPLANLPRPLPKTSPSPEAMATPAAAEVGVMVVPTTMTVQEKTDSREDNIRYKVWLNKAPSSPVTVTPKSSDTAIGTVSGAFTFTDSNWSTFQEVKVERKFDPDTTDKTFTVMYTVSGGDYSSSTAEDVEVTVKNVYLTNRGVTIKPDRLSLTEEGRGTYTVKLNTVPSGSNVIVTPKSSDTGVMSVPGDALTFASSNWDEPQEVTVMAKKDDDTKDNVVAVTHTISGGDYASVMPGDLGVTVKDTDTAAVTVTPV